MFRSRGRLQMRTWTLLTLLLDTGLQIDEALGLDRVNVDLPQLLGAGAREGNGERLVPILLGKRYLWYSTPSRRGAPPA
jgi:site-specific recombinase XerD